MQIPIQNIYYLLCYAWNKLEESEIVNVNEIDSTELIDLFAKVLSNSCSRLLKQGLDRYYVEHEDVIMGIKGKFNFNLHFKGYSMSWNFGVFIPNVDRTLFVIALSRAIHNVVSSEPVKGMFKKFKMAGMCASLPLPFNPSAIFIECNFTK